MTLQNRVECQLRTPCEPRTAREWAHCIVRHTPGHPPEQIAADTGIALKRLMKLSAPQAEAVVRVEEVFAIARATGRFGWLRFYARVAGCEIFQLPGIAAGPLDAEALDQASASLRSLADLVEKLRAITSDQHIQPDEVAQFEDVYSSHIAAVTRVRTWVQARCDSAPPAIDRAGVRRSSRSTSSR